MKKWKGEGAQGPLAWEEGLNFNICEGGSKFLVTPLPMGPACLLSEGRFEESGWGG